MQERDAVRALSALSNPARLRLFRHLVERGPDGLVAGDVAHDLELKASTLSTHLDRLTRAGLVVRVRRGRATLYVAAPEAILGLHRFLVDPCCAGEPSRCSVVVVATPGEGADRGAG